MPVELATAAPCNIIFTRHPISTDTWYPHLDFLKIKLADNRHRSSLIITKLSRDKMRIVQYRIIHVIAIKLHQHCLTDNSNVVQQPLRLSFTSTAHQNSVHIEPLGFHPVQGVV
ncbi:unnamed protein product, partial [Urochloa decumbens]